MIEVIAVAVCLLRKETAGSSPSVSFLGVSTVAVSFLGVSAAAVSFWGFLLWTVSDFFANDRGRIGPHLPGVGFANRKIIFLHTALDSLIK